MKHLLQLTIYFLSFVFLLSCSNKMPKEKTEEKLGAVSTDEIAHPKVLIHNAKGLSDLNLEYEGEVKEMKQWKDGEGKHIALITETGVYVSDKFEHENDGGDAELFAYHYILDEEKGRYELSWKIYDYRKDCPVDLEAYFVDNTFEITDLNNNGVSEVWVVYKLGCHGDVSPLEMKLIMYEGKKKYAMRGEEKIQWEVDGYTGGEYQFDPNFEKGEKVFREYAQKIWAKLIE